MEDQALYLQERMTYSCCESAFSGKNWVADRKVILEDSQILWAEDYRFYLKQILIASNTPYSSGSTKSTFLNQMHNTCDFLHFLPFRDYSTCCFIITRGDYWWSLLVVYMFIDRKEKKTCIISYAFTSRSIHLGPYLVQMRSYACWWLKGKIQR